ncbi:hypothetical protein [Actinomadura rupiterrae]|uniref:hypothetical protein n=1 Tax=Actinomadura rupiterrae TaxID=559627 RepID=UPI0020A2347A|nr:hypothetical protein [Actinomadura rupiterrae]MCP2336486.1 hypothetical protein [Actinomadura rupiterrae]
MSETEGLEPRTDDDAPDDAPEADAAEQRADLLPGDDDARDGQRPMDADEADYADQGRSVALDEDDYR